jgi:hypothetical protein
MVNLTRVEKDILRTAIENGKLSTKDFQLNYKSQAIIKKTIERFLMLKIMTQNHTEFFEVDVPLIKKFFGEEFKEEIAKTEEIKNDSIDETLKGGNDGK